MPNHCETDFYITGPREVVERVVKTHFTPDGTLDCDTVIPYPEEFKWLDRAAREWEKENCHPDNRWAVKEGVDYKTRPKNGFNSGGYEWCIKNWGTKWGTYTRRGTYTRNCGDQPQPVTLEFEDGTIEWQTTFDSAWSPPEPVLHKLAEMYPEVKIHTASYEMGMGYEYLLDFENGVCVFQEEREYHGDRGG